MALQRFTGSTRPPDVVVGLGNELAGDDGVGIAVARHLERLLAGRDDVEVVALPWAGLTLLDALAGHRRAAIVDCLVTGDLDPGTVVRLSEDDVGGSARLVSSHDLDFPTALALGRRMGLELPGEIAIWAVEGAVVDRLGEGLSPPVADAARRVTAEILDFMEPQKTSADEPH